MKNERKSAKTGLLVLLLLATIVPLAALNSASADETITPASYSTDGSWNYIVNDAITIAFPADGKKPMFLWWSTNDTNNINVVKFKGLIEYCTYENPYFLWRCQAENWRIRERIEAHYYGPKQHMLQNWQRLQAREKLCKIGNATGLHAPYLPFSSSRWRLDGPVNVTKGEVQYLSFNFTLVDTPGWRSHFQFAEENVIIRCRFYYTPATEDVYGKYSYNVDAGELKIDLIINRWEWNIDRLEPMIEEMGALGFDIPKGKASLALWVNLASINMTKLDIVESDVETMEDADITEGASNARTMYVEGTPVSVLQNRTKYDEAPMQNRIRERFRVRFEQGNATLAGFFRFVPHAIITDGTTYNTTEVTASYIEAGAHLRLFIGYPYFGNNTLEHDPSLGLEAISPWLPTSLLAVLMGATLVIVAVVAAIKLRKKTINIVGVH